jgi:replication factor C subunit 2/4
MIIKYGKISNDDLYSKIVEICQKENMEYTEDGIKTLLYLSDNDIRQSINNLECIYYSGSKFNENTVYNILDKPKPFYIREILNHCVDNNLNNAINILVELYYKGYTPNDILLSFMKYLMENKDNINLNEEYILKIYEIISLTYIRVNGGLDTLLQLCGCISKICLYLH